MKYFLMGAFATGFLLYGIALCYGAAKSTNIETITTHIANNPSDPLIIVGVLFMVIAFGFKVAAVPFHMWAPDAYQGAPTPVTGFMASAVKAAAFIGMLRVFGTAFGGDSLPLGQMGWTTAFAILAAITMTVGNIAALRQENVKRMLAYSSISHAGLLLIGVVAAGMAPAGTGQSAVLYYLVAYSVTTLGAFAIATWIGSRERERVLVADYAGLATKHPGMALGMTICLLSLGGMPPTGGFFAKFYVLKAGMEVADQTLLWLVVIGAINSVVSIFYYLRVVMAMYFREPVGEFKVIRSGGIAFVVAACATLVLQMGLMPGWWLKVAGL
jgi:NADH-quinone oxidoreductase subunit N